MTLFSELARKAIRSTQQGDIVEIGGGHGVTTKVLLGISAQENREVHVIDPFEKGWDYIPPDYRYEKKVFDATVAGFGNLHVHEFNSQDFEAWKVVIRIPDIAFAYVDGLQFYGAVRNDLMLVQKAQIICVDDADRHSGRSQVLQAVYSIYHPDQVRVVDRWAFISKDLAFI